MFLIEVVGITDIHILPCADLWRIDPLLGKDLEANKEYSRCKYTKGPFWALYGSVNKFPRKQYPGYR